MILKEAVRPDEFVGVSGEKPIEESPAAATATSSERPYGFPSSHTWPKTRTAAVDSMVADIHAPSVGPHMNLASRTSTELAVLPVVTVAESPGAIWLVAGGRRRSVVDAPD
jgi:hypothetical protein